MAQYSSLHRSSFSARKILLKDFQNINAPVGEIEGIQWTRQCRAHWQNELAPLPTSSCEEGTSAYTLVGEFVNDEPDAIDTDVWAVGHQKIAITPISIDLTAYGSL